MQLGWLRWDPDPTFFTVPLIDRPIRWYGVCFVLGFIIGYFIVQRIFTRIFSRSEKLLERDVADWDLLLRQLKREKLIHEGEGKKKALKALNSLPLTRAELTERFEKGISSPKQLSSHLTDYLTWFVIAGAIIGARLGHVFLYDWPRYQNHLLDIIKVWEGGLASHGGALGIFLAVLLFLKFNDKKFPELSFIRLLDILAVPTALIGGMIRLGNFVNQEIVGSPTEMPWGVIFPQAGPLPRHPVQLYEAAAYFAIYILLQLIWNRREMKLRPGFIAGLFFTLIFTARFFLEFFKERQGLVLDESLLQTGQLLSLPFIALGLFLIHRSRNQPIYG